MHFSAAGVVSVFLCFVAGCSVDVRDVDEPSESAEHDETAASDESALHRSEDSGNVVWARGLFETPRFLRSDGAGYAYAAGTQSTSTGPIIFVLRYSPYGNRIKFGFPSSALDAFGVASDGRMAFAGVATSITGAPPDFGCGPVERGYYIAVVRPDRSCAWMVTTGSFDVHPVSLTFGPNGELVVAGTAAGTYDLGGGTEMSTPSMVYLSRFTSTGTHSWSKVFGEPEVSSRINQQTSGADVDAAGSIHLTGRFRARIDFGGGTMTAAAGSDFENATGYLASFTSTGQYIRARQFGSSVAPHTIDAAPDGSVVIGGRFAGTVQFDEKSLTNTSGSRDIFLATFAPNGAVRWVKKLWGTATMRLIGAGFDNAGYVSVAGRFERTSTSGTRSLHIGSFDFVTNNDTRMFTAQFTPRYGTTVWANDYAAVDELAPAVTPNAFAITPNNGRLLVTGEVRGVTDFEGEAFGYRGTVTPFLLRIYP